MNKVPAAAAAVLLGAGWLLAAPVPVSEVLREKVRASNREGRALALLQHLTDRIGPRLSGSPGAAEAVRWTHAVLRDAGLSARLEPVRVPVWVRGVEKGAVTSPVRTPLVLTTLGSSEPTPPGGLEAEVVEVDSIDALVALPAERVRGRVVLFNKRLAPPRTSDEATAQYRELSTMRSRGTPAAAAKGAVAVLVRSAGFGANRLAHTGNTRQAEGGPLLPAAALALEDAELLHRLIASGDTVRVHLELGGRSAGEADSANVVAEVRGREKPEEIVVIGAHLDSWDVGTGALDDGAGVVAVMETLRLLQSLPTPPRRTVRGVLFMNEENGVAGGKAYAAAHADEVSRHVAAVESDGGAGRPRALRVVVGAGGVARLEGLLPILEPTGITAVTPSESGGVDIGPLRERGVPVIGVHQDQLRYFEWHHTIADTFDKVDPEDLGRNVEAMAHLAWALAEDPGTLPRPDPSPAAP